MGRSTWDGGRGVTAQRAKGVGLRINRKRPFVRKRTHTHTHTLGKRWGVGDRESRAESAPPPIIPPAALCFLSGGAEGRAVGEPLGAEVARGRALHYPTWRGPPRDRRRPMGSRPGASAARGPGLEIQNRAPGQPSARRAGLSVPEVGLRATGRGAWDCVPAALGPAPAVPSHRPAGTPGGAGPAGGGKKPGAWRFPGRVSAAAHTRQFREIQI